MSAPVNPYTGQADSGPLFDVRQPAHTNDPPAAKQAAARQDLPKRARFVLNGLRDFIAMWGDNPTAGELAHHLAESRHYIARGLSDLKSLGQAHHAGSRPCKVVGGTNNFTTWEG